MLPKKLAHHTMSILTGKTITQFSLMRNFVLLKRNSTIFAVEMSSTISTPHSKFQLNCARHFQDINFQNLAHFLFSFDYSSRCESYHKVKTGYPIGLKFGTQKGGVRHMQNYLQLFTKNSTNMLSHPLHITRN